MLSLLYFSFFLGTLTWSKSSDLTDPATLWDLLDSKTQKVIDKNTAEILTWQPYGNVDGGLLSPEQAALQRKWNEWNFDITSKGEIDSARLLVSYGMMPMLTSTGNKLHKAVTLGELDKVKQILNDPNENIDIESEKSDGSTPLLLAVIMGHYNITKYLLEEGAITESESNNGFTSIMFASALNHTNILKLLIDYHAWLDHPHKFAKSTALHFAVEMGHLECIKLLCENGANGEAEKSHGGRPIHIAADTNEVNSLKNLIKYCKVDLESKLVNDTTAMYLAAQNGYNKVIKVLLDNGAIIDYVMPSVARRDVVKVGSSSYNKYGFSYGAKNSEIGNGATPLHAAAENGHYSTVKLLLERGSRQLASMEGSDPLYLAIQYNHPRIVKLLLKYNPDTINNNKIRHGHSSLYLCATLGKHKMMKMLLDRKDINPNIKTRDNITPIYVACANRYPKIVKLLLTHNNTKDRINVKIKSKTDKSISIHIASQSKCLLCIKYLLEYDINLLRIKGPDNQLPIHLLLNNRNNRLTNKRLNAIKNITEIMLQYYINKGKNINDLRIKSSNGTILHVAVQSGLYEVVKLLLEYGCNVNATANDLLYGAHPLLVASQSGYDNIVKLLLDYNSDPNIVMTTYHASSLYLAAENGHIKVVKHLLDNNETDVNIQNNLGLTAVHIACRNGYGNIVKLFMKYNITIAIAKDATSTDYTYLEEKDVDRFCAKKPNVKNTRNNSLNKNAKKSKTKKKHKKKRRKKRKNK